MNRMKLVIVTFIVILIGSILVLNDIRSHRIEHELIQGSEIDRTGYSFTNADGTELRIKSSENVICVKVDDVIYTVGRLDLNNILNEYKYTKSRAKSDIYSTDNYSIEISVSDESGPKHILLGENYTIWYESGGDGEFEIIDGEVLIEEILELTEVSEPLDFNSPN